MRRAMTLASLAVLALATVALGGCKGDTAPEPTVASVDFTPTARLDVDDHGDLQVKIVDGTTLPSGSVLLVTNVGDADHRLVGTIDTTQVFDTGTMEPGDDTTVVLVPDGDLHVADLSTDRETTVTVTPRSS